MKKVTRCYRCRNITRLNETYMAKLETPELDNGRMVEEIRLCRHCAMVAGYKVKGLNPKSVIEPMPF